MVRVALCSVSRLWERIPDSQISRARHRDKGTSGLVLDGREEEEEELASCGNGEMAAQGEVFSEGVI